MAVSLKLANLWRVIRDVDLEAIRQSARRRFELLIIGEHQPDAEAIRAFLNPGRAETPHPWITTAPASAGVPSTALSPVAALLVSRTNDLAIPLATTRQTLVERGVPVVLVVLGDAPAAHTTPRAGERGRVRLPTLDRAAARTLGAALIDAVPEDMRLALAVQLPVLQPAVFDAIVEDTARANASFALTTGLAEIVPVLTAPLNLGDMIILTKNQLVMSYRIALAAGRDGEPRRLIAEILGVLGGGLLFRQIARQLVGLIPVVGLLPKVAVAYGGTWAIGRAMTLWAVEGREISTDVLRRFSAEGLARGRTVARRMVDQARTTGHRASGRWERLRGALPPLPRREAR